MVSKNFKNTEYLRVENLIEKSKIFNGDKGGGFFRGKSYPFILENSENNLFSSSKDKIIDYFRENRISWWNGRSVTNHTLSSQVTCLNHLFPIREDKDSVLALIKGIDPDIEDVLLLNSDHHMPAYIQFEAISDKDHLNEMKSTRGSNCTSLDALICGVRKDGTRVMFPIEWKHIEVYGNEDKASGDRGKTRKERYTDLLNESAQLKDNQQDTYYFEPFYQLMRQTLWAEQMVKHKNIETVKADDFIHIHIIPSENKNLLNKAYPCSGKDMEETWRDCIINQSKYVIISPKELLSPLDETQYTDLFEYLNKRYW